MPGCNSKCSFSLERNDIIKCLDGCKQGYIEITEGICDSCNEVNRGCQECHYENNYPINYLGIKRKRRFVCDNCESEYYIKINDKCVRCYDIEEGCEKCQIENNEFKCKECMEYGAIFDNEGHCNYCQWGSFSFSFGKKVKR